uniref:P-type phospholipid transporter n=1 Tax=Caenorhabditis japonica TaxID=281687 RepID=A0A8R1ECC0_CAEJA
MVKQKGMKFKCTVKRVIESEVDAEVASESAGLNIIMSPTAIRLAQDGNPHLIEALKKAKSVLCYRMTPSEKATIVNTVKKKIKGNVLAIGDGANDVPMIQAAHVGIGIAGKEGLQAAMACDFAIARFKFLSRLLLVHGHWCYYRLSNTFLYFLYKNANAVFIVFYFQFFNGASGTDIIDPLYGVAYPIIFTSVQPVIVGVLDQDDDDETLMNNPEKYGIGRENQLYTWKYFFRDVADGIYQAAVIYYVTHLTLMDSNASFWEFGFYIAIGSILVNSAHLALQVRYWHWPIITLFLFFIFLTFAYFFAECLISGLTLVPDAPVWMPVYVVGNGKFWFCQIIMLIVALCPRFTSQCLISSLNATTNRKTQ